MHSEGKVLSLLKVVSLEFNPDQYSFRSLISILKSTGRTAGGRVALVGGQLSDARTSAHSVLAASTFDKKGPLFLYGSVVPLAIFHKH